VVFEKVYVLLEVKLYWRTVDFGLFSGILLLDTIYFSVSKFLAVLLRETTSETFIDFFIG